MVGKMWRDVTGNFRTVALLIILWLILMERMDTLTTILGVLVSIGTVCFVNKYLVIQDYERHYNFKLGGILRYIFILIYEIAISGASVFFDLIRGKFNVVIIEYETSLNDGMLISLLANSVTLTPGTVSVDRNGKVLKLLCLNPPEKGREKEIVSQKLEQILKNLEEKPVSNKDR